MLSLEQYPMVLRSDGARGRPRHVEPMLGGFWRVDWIDGPASIYRGDPRADLRLGYEPKHLRRADPR
jgi:hypothetical protein